MLLALASIAFLGSESLWTRNQLYCLRFETSLFVASYDSQSLGGGIRSRPHKGLHAELCNIYDSVRTSQETHYVSTTKPNTNTLCGQNAVFWYVLYVATTGL
jgi:hypothetical protein